MPGLSAAPQTTGARLVNRLAALSRACGSLADSASSLAAAADSLNRALRLSLLRTRRAQLQLAADASPNHPKLAGLLAQLAQCQDDIAALETLPCTPRLTQRPSQQATPSRTPASPC